MPEFHLDSSGTVPLPYNRSVSNPERMTHFHDLDSFTQGYIQALFLTENEPGTTREERVTPAGNVRKAWAKRVEEGQQKDMPGDYGFSDIAPDTLTTMMEDCARFQRVAEALLTLAYECDYNEEQAGRDFWFTRNGHGVGFWDRDALKTDDSGEYEKLTAEMAANRDNNAAWDAACAKRAVIKSETIAAQLAALCGWESRNNAESFPGVDAYIGDDGKVYLS